MRYYLAIDIGASSGRHIVAWQEDDELKTEEIYRFPNGVETRDGHLIWDIQALYAHVKEGIRLAFARCGSLESLSVDTWGVDYVLLDGDREILPCYAYRDHRTEEVIGRLHKLVPFYHLYRRTGCQFQSFNTIYQLFWDKEHGRLDHATDYLMLPEYLMYKLSGVKAHEFTNATTMGLVSAASLDFDRELIRTLGLPERLFGALSQPGTVLGSIRPELAEELGGTCRVVLCATHDTASAVEGIPMQGNHPYISSGTWSLLGVKTDRPLTDAKSQQENWSNEGGVGYNRYQKNIMGMWLVNRLREELCPGKDFGEIVAAARESTFDATVDANDGAFLAPESMKAAFDAALQAAPASAADYFRCAYRSLALSYGEAIRELEHNTGKSYDTLYIVGGGAKNAFLNELTERATGKRVIALPLEATALGNLRIQSRTMK